MRSGGSSNFSRVYSGGISRRHANILTYQGAEDGPPREISVPRLPQQPPSPQLKQSDEDEHLSEDEQLLEDNRIINKRRHGEDMIWGDISAITAADILYVGLVYAGFEKARQTVAFSENLQRFIDFYGVPPTTAEPLFRDLRDRYPDIRYKVLLMTMNWFRLYNLERVLSGRWGIIERPQNCVRKL